MLSALKSEFRKLLSIRSTYVITLLAFAIVALFSFYGGGIKGPAVMTSDALEQVANNAISIVGIFVGIIAILAICHEYRYNTIYYTLTSSNNRLKVFFAKYITLAIFAIVMNILFVLFAMGALALGAHLAHHELGSQVIDVYSLGWRTFVYIIGASWLGLALGFLSRSVVFAIVAYFLIPSIEPLLHNFLKVSNNYLPSASQNQILEAATAPGVFSPLGAAGIFYLYLLVTGIIAAVLFMRRDAN
jgi:ABC-type transport system involved in multi-copper enzyme maturation permease subunit